MKTQSDTRPPASQKLQGGTLIAFNIEEITVEHMGESHKGYEYDQVKVSDEPTRSEIIEAVIRSKYSASDELAIIHNGKDTPKHTEEFDEFMAYRVMAKEIAANV
jgi:hypothetical protein